MEMSTNVHGIPMEYMDRFTLGFYECYGFVNIIPYVSLNFILTYASCSNQNISPLHHLVSVWQMLHLRFSIYSAQQAKESVLWNINLNSYMSCSYS